MKKIFVLAIPIVYVFVILLVVISRSNQTSPKPKADGGTIDTLPYILGKHAIGNSSDPKNNGITSYVKGNSIFYVKSASGVQYEYRTWDANNIYLNQDTSVGGVTVEGQEPNSYTFSSGIWLKRYMSPGEVITVNPNITWFNRCSKVATWTNWSYQVSITGPTVYNVGGDLGNQEVIILKYDYQSGYELFYYSKNWGWVRWEEWDTESKTLKRSGNFNRVSDSFYPLKVQCGTPDPKLTPPPKPTATPTVSPTPTPTPTPSPTPPPASCPNPTNPACYDCNADRSITILDFTCFKSEFGKTERNLQYDCSDDGQVNILDFACFRNNFQKTY